MIDIDKDPVLAAEQGLTECRHLEGVSDYIVGPPHLECHKGIIGDVADPSFAVCHSVNRIVVHQHQYTVLGHLHIKLHHIHSHTDD